MNPAKRRYLVTALMGGLFAALPFLAWLQYRWIGEAGRAEIERTRATLRRSAGQLAGEFDDAISRLHSMVLATTPEDRDSTRYGIRYHEWLTMTPDAGIIRALFITEGGQNGVGGLYRWNRQRNTFDRADWPAELMPLKTELSTRARPGGGIGHVGPPGTAFDVPVLAAPRTPYAPVRYRPEPDPEDGPRRQPGVGLGAGRRPPPGEPPPAPPGDGWVIAWLDLDYLRVEWMPALVRKYFPADGRTDYDVRVVSRISGRVLFDSDPSAPADAFRKPDADVAMLPARAGRPGAPQGPPDPESGVGPPGVGRWRLLVRDRSGRLENEVASGRARNLAVSGGVLLLMAVSLVALLFAINQADRLAVQQMQFVAAISHELRTPLAVIRSAAENLADGIVTGAEPVREYGAVIGEEGRRLSYLIEQTLRFAGIQTGRTRYNLIPSDVSAVIEDAMKSCEGALRNSGCALDTTIDSGIPRVLADPAALAVCVGNLLTNAAKHARLGGWIGVRASVAGAGAGTHVHIAVSDRGSGINPRDLPHIFEPFYRGQKAESQQIPGTGLGLALVRQIITAHNGDITVTSRPGQGSCFTLSLRAAASVDLGQA